LSTIRESLNPLCTVYVAAEHIRLQNVFNGDLTQVNADADFHGFFIWVLPVGVNELLLNLNSPLHRSGRLGENTQQRIPDSFEHSARFAALNYRPEERVVLHSHV
jgi:hypothetical protein